MKIHILPLSLSEAMRQVACVCVSGLGFEPSGDDAAKEEEADHERTHDARPSSSRIPRNANTAMFGTRDRHLPTLAPQRSHARNSLLPSLSKENDGHEGAVPHF